MSEHAAAQSGRAIATRGLKKADRAADLFCIELGIGSSRPCYPNLRSTVKIFHSFSDFLWLYWQPESVRRCQPSKMWAACPPLQVTTRSSAFTDPAFAARFGGVGGYGRDK